MFIKQTPLPWDKHLAGRTQQPGNASAQPDICQIPMVLLEVFGSQSTFGTSLLCPFPAPLCQLVGSISSCNIPVQL